MSKQAHVIPIGWLYDEVGFIATDVVCNRLYDEIAALLMLPTKKHIDSLLNGENVDISYLFTPPSTPKESCVGDTLADSLHRRIQTSISTLHQKQPFLDLVSFIEGNYERIKGFKVDKNRNQFIVIFEMNM